MALNMNFETQDGFLTENGYIRIENITQNKNLIAFNSLCYKDSTARDSEKACNPKFDTLYKNITIDINKNSYTQAYDYLKTLPEFQNAVNC